jgi:hypothetical protein
MTKEHKMQQIAVNFAPFRLTILEPRKKKAKSFLLVFPALPVVLPLIRIDDMVAVAETENGYTIRTEMRLGKKITPRKLVASLMAKPEIGEAVEAAYKTMAQEYRSGMMAMEPALFSV